MRNFIVKSTKLGFHIDDGPVTAMHPVVVSLDAGG